MDTSTQPGKPLTFLQSEELRHNCFSGSDEIWNTHQLRRGIRQRFCGRCNALTWVPFHDFSNHCNLDLWSGQGFKRKRSKILKRSNCSFRTPWAFSITNGVAFKSPTKRSKEGGWGQGHRLFLRMYFPKNMTHRSHLINGPPF